MKNDLAGLTVGIVCAVVMIGTVLVPSINEIVDGNVTTYTNAGNGLTFEIDSDSDLAFVTDANPRNWTLNGETYNVYVAGNTTYITTDLFRVFRSGAWLTLYDSTGATEEAVNMNLYLVKMDYDASAGTFVFTKYEDTTDTTVAATHSYDVKHIMYYTPSGNYVAYVSDGETAPNGYYVNDTSQIVCGGAYTTGNLDTSYFGQGETVTVGVSDYSAYAEVTTVKAATDVLECSEYTVYVTNGTDTESFIPYTIYVPATIEGHTTEQATINTLYGIIPLFLIIAVLLGVTYAVMRNRD